MAARGAFGPWAVVCWPLI